MGCGEALKEKFFSDPFKEISDPNVFSKGCVEQGKALVKDNVYLVGGVGVGIAVVKSYEKL